MLNKKVKDFYDNLTLNYVENNNGCTLNDIYKHINYEISKSSIIVLLKKKI